MRGGIAPSNLATFCGFHALTIYDPGCWLGLTALGQTRDFHQLTVHIIQQGIIAPRVKITPRRRNRQKVIGQHTPPLMVCCVNHCRAVIGIRSLQCRGSRRIRRTNMSCEVDQLSCAVASKALSTPILHQSYHLHTYRLFDHVSDG
jgi:hypothetical protein